MIQTVDNWLRIRHLIATHDFLGLLDFRTLSLVPYWRLLRYRSDLHRLPINVLLYCFDFDSFFIDMLRFRSDF